MLDVLRFTDAEGAVALMGCNADGSYVGMAADTVTIAITDLCKMSNCRIDRMLNSLVSELPAFLKEILAQMKNQNDKGERKHD